MTDDAADRFEALVVFLILVVVIGLTAFHLDLHDIHENHHAAYNSFRIFGLSEALKDSSSWRWFWGFNYGWGYPLFYYTAVLPYMIPAILVRLGVSQVASINGYWHFLILASAVSMYFSCRGLLGRFGGLLSTVCYLLSPYFLMDVYVRGNMGEIAIYILFPLLVHALSATHKQQDPRRVLLLASGISFILVSSYLLSLVLVPLSLGIFSFFALLFQRRMFKPVLAALPQILLLALGLSAWLWLPALADLDAVQGRPLLTDGYFSYKLHFVYPEQLISDFWGYGGSCEGSKDGLSLSLGFEIILLSAVSVLLAIGSLVIKKSSRRAGSLARWTLVFATTAASLIFLSTTFAGPVWDYCQPLQVLQFPWRLHLMSSFFLSLCVGAGAGLVAESFGRRYFALCWVCIAICWIGFKELPHAHPNPDGKIIRYEELNPETVVESGVNTSSGEFLPLGIVRYPVKSDVWTEPAYLLSAADKTHPVPLTEGRLINGSYKIELNSAAPAVLVVRQFFHPAWRAEIDGRAATLGKDKSHPLQPLMLEVPAGRHKVELFFGMTKAGKVGTASSIFCGILYLWLLFKVRQVEALQPADELPRPAKSARK